MGEPIEVRQPRQIVPHQRDVRRLQGGVTPGGAHGDPDGSDSERGSVVHAVSDHGHGAVLGLQRADRGDLLLRQQSGANLIHADRFSDGVGGLLVVSSEHHDMADTRGAERRDRGCRGLPRFVRKREPCENLALAREADDRAAPDRQLPGTVSLRTGADEHRRLADHVLDAVQARPRATPEFGREVGDGARVVERATFACGIHERLRDGMFGVCLDGRRTRKGLALGQLPGGMNGDDPRVPHCERPRLVHRDDLDSAHGFQIATALDEDAVSGGRRDSADHRHGRGDDQRTRTGDDQQGQPTNEPHAEVTTEEQRRDRHDEHGRHRDGGGVVTREALDEALGRALVRLGVFDEAHNTRQGAVRGWPCGTHAQEATPIDGSGEDGVSRRLVDRDRFSRDRGLIDGGRAFLDDAVGRQTLAGTE